MILRVRDENGKVFDIPAIRGLSSYEIAVKHGFEGTEKEWLDSIGVLQGLSAFEVALEEGFDGSVEEWLDSLIGPQGEQGPQGDKGETGDKGDTPVFAIGTVTTLSAGSNATVTITGTPSKPVLNFGIPKGDKGDKGATGSTGTSLPSVSSSDNGKFLRVVSGSWSAVAVSNAEGVSF